MHPARARRLHHTSLAPRPIVGSSPAVRRLREAIRRIGPSDSTVLLTGETGVGKGLAAERLHALSPRASRELVHVDCAALAPSVIESELFGHVRGAFTGASSDRPGRFELAAGGTLFLDEIGELEPRLQAKLLRVLQDRRFERVGGRETLCMSGRILAATNRDLGAAVRDGAFRADLLYRLRVVELRLPSLRERITDLPELIAQALDALSERLSRPPPPVSPSFVQRLAAHDWPGNVRELWNLLERLLVAHGAVSLDGEAAASVLDACGPLPGPRATAAEPAATDVRGCDRDGLAAVLVATGGNVSRAARRLGVPRSTLRHRIERFGLHELIPRD
ncbi:MAG: sigma 54-interacting transcriptional regulator [Myxococcota bacterium]|nr:sigma 54-interacting transcriptional regulator [Myxococcota bacterium]